MVNCVLVCNCKGKLLLHVVFSLGFHVESNLKILAMAPRHSLTYAQRVDGARGLQNSKSCTSGMTHYTMLVQLGIWSYFNEIY